MSPIESHGTLEPDEIAAQAQWVRGLALALVRDAHAADDLAQSSLAAALGRPERPQGDLRAWLGGLVRNLARMHARSERHRAQREQVAARAELSPDSNGSTEALERIETQELLLRAVRELDEPYRTVVLMRWFEGLEPREIARRRGVPVRTVHTQTTRALALLRARLDRRARGDRAAWMSAWIPLLRARPSAPSTLVNVMAISSKVVGAGIAACGLLAVAWFVSTRGESAGDAELAHAAPPALEAELASESPLLVVDVPVDRVPATSAPVVQPRAASAERQPTLLVVRVRDANGPVEHFAIEVKELGRRRPPHDLWKRAAHHPGGEAQLDTSRSDFEVHVHSELHALLVLGPLHASAETQILDVLLAPLALLRGRVLHDDRPVEGARVTLHCAIPAGTRAWHDGLLVRSLDGESAQTTSARDGSFALPLRAAGRCWLRARKDGLVDGEVGPLDLGDLDDRGDGVEHIIELTLGGSIEGLVLLPAGTASYEEDVPQLDPRTLVQYTTTRGRMQVVATRGDGFARVVAPDDQGRFRFDGLMPGAWYVGRNPPGSVSTTAFDDGPGLTEVAANCEVSEGRVTQHDVDLRAGRGTILTVRFALGERPLAGWNVRCAGTEHASWSRGDHELEGNGTVVVDVLPGPCVLHVSGKLGKHTSLNVREELALQSGTQSWEFRPAVGAVVGRVLDPVRARSGQLELAWRDGPREALCSVPLADDGSFHAEDLPAGDWFVGTWSSGDAVGGNAPLPALRVVAGATVNVELP